MERKKIVSILVGGALTMVTAFGAITYGVVKAQAPTTTPGTQTAPNGAGLPGFGREMRGGYTDEDLAAALGISVDQLQTAEQTARDEALKQAVAAGLITQAQADQLAQRGFDGRHIGGFPGLNNSGIDYNALLAQALGISTDDLQAAYQKAYTASIDQAVQDGTLTQEQADAAKGRYALSNSSKFIAAMKSAFEAAVNQAVSDGLITQAQADQVLSSSNGNGFGFGGLGGFGGPGGRGGHGGRGGPGWNGQIPSNPNPTLPSAPTTVPSSGSGL